MSTPENFVIDLGALVDRAKSRLSAFPMAVAMEALADLQARTPVDTGNLRASWQLSRYGDDSWRITTNVVYARRVNFGFVGTDSLGRHFNQGGRHFIEATIADLPRLADEVAARFAGGRA